MRCNNTTRTRSTQNILLIGLLCPPHSNYNKTVIRPQPHSRSRNDRVWATLPNHSKRFTSIRVLNKGRDTVMTRSILDTPTALSRHQVCGSARLDPRQNKRSGGAPLQVQPVDRVRQYRKGRQTHARSWGTVKKSLRRRGKSQS